MDKIAQQVNEIDAVVASLNEIQADATVPRNVRTKIENIVKTLNNSTEVSINVNKALNDLDEIAGDVNLQSYTRTQVWNVMSLLEKLC